MKKIFLLSLVLLTACSTPLQIQWHAAKHLNPDEQNHALPVQVVIYQLRDAEAFRQATFEQLWQSDQATLGNSLVSRRETNIAPNSRDKITIDRQKDTVYIGIIAVFRHPQGGHWRALKKIGKGVPLTNKHLNLILTGSEIKLS
jgi:type VI secretion system protein VasD